MWGHPETANRRGLLADEIRSAQAVTPALISHVMAGAGGRLATLGHTGKTARLDRLIEASAWTEAALALIELELPRWQLRRLVHDEGEWVCSLSRQPNLPMEIDDTADGRHEILPLALLGALLEAKRLAADTSNVRSAAVPQVKPATATVVCCDNFA